METIKKHADENDDCTQTAIDSLTEWGGYDKNGKEFNLAGPIIYMGLIRSYNCDFII